MLTKQVYIVVLQKWKIFIILLWFLLLLLLLLPEMTEHIWVYVVVLFIFLLPIFTYAKSWFDFISQRTDRTRNDWRGDWSLCIDFREWTRRFIQSWGFCIFFFCINFAWIKLGFFFGSCKVLGSNKNNTILHYDISCHKSWNYYRVVHKL